MAVDGSNGRGSSWKVVERLFLALPSAVLIVGWIKRYHPLWFILVGAAATGVAAVYLWRWSWLRWLYGRLPLAIKADLPRANADLGRRNRILGFIMDFTRWTNGLAEADVISRHEYFRRINRRFIDFVQDEFPQVQRIAILVPDGEGNLMIEHGARFEPGRELEVRLSLADSAAGYALSRDETFYSGKLSTDPHSRYRALPGSKVIESLLCIPVRVDGPRSVAVLSCDSVLPDMLDEDNIELVETLTRVLGTCWTVYGLLEGSARCHE